MAGYRPHHNNNININVNNAAGGSSYGGHRGFRPPSRNEAWAIVAVTLILVLGVHGLLIPGLIIGGLIGALYIYGQQQKRKLAVPGSTLPSTNGQAASTSQPFYSIGKYRTPEFDVIANQCQWCLLPASGHIVPDGNHWKTDVREFHGLPPRLVAQRTMPLIVPRASRSPRTP